MATQRYISTSFWTDKWVRTLDPAERYLYIYLLTNPQTNIAGVYQITMDRIAFDTGYDERTLEPMLRRFAQAGKAHMIDDEWMAIPSWPKHQRISQRGKVLRGIRKILSELPPDVYHELERVGYEFPLGDDQPEDRPSRAKMRDGQRQRIMERDGHKCQFCGATENLEIDHIKPASLGGGNEDKNLRVLCQECNGKRNAELRWEHDGTLSRVTHKNGWTTEPSGYHSNYSDSDSDLDTDTDTDKSMHTANAVEPLGSESETVAQPPAKPKGTQKDPDAAAWESILTQIQPSSTWSNYGKERQSCKTLAQRSRQLLPDVPFDTMRELMQAVVQEYGRLKRQNRQAYWKQAPWTPSAVLQRWSQVWDSIAQRNAVGEEVPF